MLENCLESKIFRLLPINIVTEEDTEFVLIRNTESRRNLCDKFYMLPPVLYFLQARQNSTLFQTSKIYLKHLRHP